MSKTWKQRAMEAISPVKTECKECHSLLSYDVSDFYEQIQEGILTEKTATQKLKKELQFFGHDDLVKMEVLNDEKKAKK